MVKTVRRHVTYSRASWLFLRFLGLVYLVAFWSIGLQIRGLIGHDGILPAADLMAAARHYAETQGLGPFSRFLVLPTVFWWGASDRFLIAVSAGGQVLALCLLIGLAPPLIMSLLWVAYLSLSVVCREFLSYQWDALLLETGFLAIFVAPLTWFDRGAWDWLRRRSPGAATAADLEPSRGDGVDGPRPLARWLLWWLLFRLMFASGVVKLASGDPTWHGLYALTVHYETQPLPTPLGWYAHHLPAVVQRVSTAFVLAVELAVPFSIVAPRRARTIGFAILVILQALIALTGNYAFFNLLTVALCILLLDDRTFDRILKRFRAPNAQPAILIPPDPAATPTPPRGGRRFPLWVPAAVAVITLPISIEILASQLGLGVPGSSLIARVDSFAEPFHSINGYGLFAVMTTTRPEIIVEGSDDGTNWLAYEFKYKPGDLRRAPPWVAPYQPRLDWQMWFAALGSYDQAPWFESFCRRLLEGSPSVVELLAATPFPQRPPRFLRAVLYRYHVADLATHRREGVWWVREKIGLYSPVLSLQ
jgi:hypothetical protein